MTGHEHDWYSPDMETVACRHCGGDYLINPDDDERYCPARPVERGDTPLVAQEIQTDRKDPPCG